MNQFTLILRTVIVLSIMGTIGTTTVLGQRCAGKIEFRIHDQSGLVYQDSLRRGKLRKAKICLPGTQYVLRLEQNGKAVKQLNRLPNKGVLSLTAGCGGDFLLEIERKGSEPAKMRIMFMDIPDRKHYLQIDFHPGDYRLSIPSLPKRPSTNPGIPDDFDLTPADWQVYRTNF